MVVGYVQFRSSSMSDLSLSKFNACTKQHVVNFFRSISYFQLKEVPAEMRLPVAMKTITEDYTQDWVVTIYKELRNCDHFKQAIVELL
jgi:hypothetical protein